MSYKTLNHYFLNLVPFDEEDKDKDVWFFDHEYLENMYTMFKKVNGIFLFNFALKNVVRFTICHFDSLKQGKKWSVGITQAHDCTEMILRSTISSNRTIQTLF